MALLFLSGAHSRRKYSPALGYFLSKFFRQTEISDHIQMLAGLLQLTSLCFSQLLATGRSGCPTTRALTAGQMESVSCVPITAFRYRGPDADKHYIQSTILQAARDVGVDLRQVGSRAYSTNTLESGWIPSPLPGIYTGDGMMQEYRDWLAASSYEAIGSIGGSFVSDNKEDYYVNPFELGYGFYIGWKKDDFLGKSALKAMKTAPNRNKVTFEWNREDVLAVMASSFEDGLPYKWIDFPQPNYASSSADMVMRDGQMVGMSMFNGYSFNERCFLSLRVADASVEIDGSGGGTRTPDTRIMVLLL